MMQLRRKLPIGIQDFEELRRGGYVYVDKTEYVYWLVHMGKPYFLSRPRRFGKSLLLSTLRAYFEGKKELFAGLKIEELERGYAEAWQAYPVFYFDFNKKNFQAEAALEEVLNAHLSDWEKIFGEEYASRPLEERFQRLLVSAYEKTGKQVVVLVDEYDKPLLELNRQEVVEHNRAVFKGFFSTLKSYDRYLKFVFLTGVTRFSKVSVFSDLNQLNDISLDRSYSSICGITEAELKRGFDPEVEALAEAEEMGKEECYDSLRKMYDGYHFAYGTEGVYNPFSLLNAFSKKEFGAYWFSTGTPAFLIDRLRNSRFDTRKITEGELYAEAAELTDYSYDNPNPVPLLYQSGYLTISGYDKKYRSYQLNYPNDEVRYGFLKSLVPLLLNDVGSAETLDIRAFGNDIETGNTDNLKNRFTALFARLPYPGDERVIEQSFQNVVYIVFMLLGQYTMTEVHSSRGRADCVVETEKFVYIFEFKRDKSAREALRQIDERGYAKPYSSDKRVLIKIGVNFSSVERNVSEWEVEMQGGAG